MAVKADDRGRAGRTLARDPAPAFAAALEAMRRADNDYARLLALRDGAEAIGSIDSQALEKLRTEAIRVHHIKPDVVQAVLAQGAELASTSRGRRVYVPPKKPAPIVELNAPALDRAIECVRPHLDRSRPLPERVRGLWAGVAAARNLGPADVVGAAFMQLAIKTGIGVDLGRHADEDLRHVIRWGLLNRDPFGKRHGG